MYHYHGHNSLGTRTQGSSVVYFCEFECFICFIISILCSSIGNLVNQAFLKCNSFKPVFFLSSNLAKLRVSCFVFCSFCSALLNLNLAALIFD